MVDVEREGPVARIFLNRPEKANALSSVVLVELRDRLAELGSDASIKAVVLGGRGRTFCGGADMHELKSLDASSAGPFVEKIHHVCKAIRELPVPVVARLHGAVIGSGLAAEREALRLQKQLLQLWDEASLATSVAASIERFARAHR